MLGDRWGVTDAEVEADYACDRLVERPTLQAWRGVSVDAAPEQVWPWVAQVRVAPYSYDWVDNLGRRSPDRLLGLPEPIVGEPFTATAGRPLGRVHVVEPGRALTGEILGSYLTYAVVPSGAGTRLLLKVVARLPRLLAPAVSVGDLVMARRQLLNWKRLAERGT